MKIVRGFSILTVDFRTKWLVTLTKIEFFCSHFYRVSGFYFESVGFKWFLFCGSSGCVSGDGGGDGITIPRNIN